MFKYTANDIITYAKSLADLQQTSFISWGDSIKMINAAYRQIYNDMIQGGDLYYLKEVRLLTKGTSLFSLPDDLYKIAMVSDEFGNEIPMLGLASSAADTGYRIKGETILLQNVSKDAIIKYYPTPDTITYKAERTVDNATFNSCLTSGTYHSAWGDKIYAGTMIKSYKGGASTVLSLGTVSAYLMGRDAIAVKFSGSSTYTIYYLNQSSSSSSDSLLHPSLTTSGGLVSNPIIPTGNHGWSNDDLTSTYYNYNGSLYYNGTKIYNSTVSEGRCIYWNGKWCLLATDRIFYPDGSYETTDTTGVVGILKADMDTGYGYITRTGYNTYAVEGWAPNTQIDYPDNILFDLTAYDLAIRYRIKQSADSSALLSSYNSLRDTYWKSISRDDANFVTIRNVNHGWSRWRFN